MNFSGSEFGAVVPAIKAEGYAISEFDGLDTVRGAYLLLLGLSCPVHLRSRMIEQRRLAPGDYIYAGSAWGAGGIRARVGRHLKQRKRRHWHIDDVTEAADYVYPIAVPGGRECHLVHLLIATGRFSVPVKGFGSSDCSRCDSHLLISHESQEIDPTP